VSLSSSTPEPTPASAFRAAVMTGPGSIEVRSFPRPELEPGAVLMRVIYSGICGTDKHTYRGETRQYVGTPHEKEVAYPLICGHENVGEVLETGGVVLDSEGTPLRSGDRIVPAANVPCGRCYYCLNGFPYYSCERLEDYGNSLGSDRPPHLLGGWSEAMVLLPGTPIFRVPDELPSEVAVLTEEMSVTHGLATARVVAAAKGAPDAGGESVAILGVGPLGLCHLVRARLTGYGRIIAIDLLDGRLRAAKSLGASVAIGAAGTDEGGRLAQVRDATDGRGADVVVDCSGDPRTFGEALRMVRYGGTVIEAGAFVDMGSIPVNPTADICARDVTVLGVGGERASLYLPTMRLLAAGLDLLPLRSIVSHRMPLDRAAEAIALSMSEASVKVVFAPNGGSA
jgi:threonine dehydrogenase-like Zn-dependent dehydrogenase